MNQIVFASNNKKKLEEIRFMLRDKFHVLSLNDIGCAEELPETSDTLEGNAIQKASYVFENYKVNCFADDTGLEVEALDGRPGVYSARYAGPICSSEENITKLLGEMNGKVNRKARFRTVIALVKGHQKELFEGVAEGEITKMKSGSKGFGYDPVFRPLNADKTFADMNPEEKNAESHRAKAVKKLVEYLKKNPV